MGDLFHLITKWTSDWSKHTEEHVGIIISDVDG